MRNAKTSFILKNFIEKHVRPTEEKSWEFTNLSLNKTCNKKQFIMQIFMN